MTAPDQCRYDACVTVDDSVEAEGDIGITTVAGGSFTLTLHEGPYDRLNETYATLLGAWFPARGYEPGAPPSMEFYLNDPHSTDPQDMLTELYMPIQEEQ